MLPIETYRNTHSNLTQRNLVAHIRLYHPSDAGEVVSLPLREADRDELAALSELSVEECIEFSITNSELTWVIVNNQGSIVGVFGLSSTKDTNRDPVGVPWMLSAETLNDFKYAFSKHSMGVVADMLERYPYLSNYVDSRNELSIKWLRWLGFTIHTDEEFYFKDKTVAFYRFSKVA